MFSFKKLWEQLKSGEDIDLFLYLLVTVVFTIAAFTGYSPKNQGFPLLATGVSFILYTILSIRYLSKQIFDKVSSPSPQAHIEQKVEKILEKITTPSVQDYTTEWPKSINEDLSRAKDISFYGIHLHITIDQYFNLLEEKVKEGGKIKFLFADPNGAVCNMVKLRYPGNTFAADDQMIKSSIHTIGILKKKYPENVQMKSLDYLFPRMAYILDPETRNGCIYVSNYTFRLGRDKSKYQYIEGKGNWFDLLYKEFCNMWKCGNEIHIDYVLKNDGG